jgi:aminoglycoside 6'-N-acetyltransferase
MPSGRRPSGRKSKRDQIPSIILEGPRVSIRPVEWEDLPTLCGWWNDPTVMKEVRAEKFKPNLEQVQKSWVAWRDAGTMDYHEFIICLGDRSIGEIGYVFENVDQETASIDIKIGDPSLWGQGLGTEAMMLLIDYLLMHVKAHRITAQPGDWNKRSMRLFEKCGFIETKREWVPVSDFFDGGVGVTMVLNREPFDKVAK